MSTDTLATAVRRARRQLTRLGPPSLRLPADPTQRNIACLYHEIVWGSMLSAAASFNAAFAVRLGASKALMGIYASLPSLLSLLLLLPFARFLETRKSPARWVAGAVLVARLGYGTVAVLPWLLTRYRAEAVIAVLILQGIPGILYNAGWNPLFADVVPPADRPRVQAVRSILSSAIVAVLTLLAGRWLEASQGLAWARFPGNYQVMYLLGFGTSLIGVFYLLALRPPAKAAKPRTVAPLSLRGLLGDVRSVVGERTEFRRLIFNTIIYDAGGWLISPLMAIYLVRQLGAGDSWLGLNTALGSVSTIVGYAAWRHGVRRLGVSRTLRFTAVLTACYPLLLALFPNLTAVLIIGVAINLIGAGFSLGHYPTMLALPPEDRRPTYLATYNVIMSVGSFLLPMLGVALAGVMDIRLVFVLAGVLRMGGALLFSVNRIAIREEEVR